MSNDMAGTDPTPASSGERLRPDSFEPLQRRFLSLTSRLEVLSQALYSEAYTPKGVTPVAFVLGETTAEMVELQADVEVWCSNHEHTAKAEKDLGPGTSSTRILTEQDPFPDVSATGRCTCPRCDGEGCAWCEPE